MATPRPYAAPITGAYVALALACRKLVKQGTIARNPILSEVAAVSVGIIEGTPILDLAYVEDSNADVDMNVVCTGLGKFIELQGTAEKEPFSREQMDQMLMLADIGVNKLFEIQRNALAT
jgi:ribonuclease PH